MASRSFWSATSTSPCGRGPAPPPGRRASALAGGIIQLHADDEAVGAAERPRFDLAPLGLAIVAAVQPAAHPPSRMRLQGEADVHRGVDRYGARPRRRSRAKDARE